MKLFAPQDYWETPKDVLDKIVHGCGPGTGWKESLIPDTIWGLSITGACNVHDFMYYAGENLTDKDEADRVFLNNILRTIDANTEWGFMKWLRRRRAYKYYEAVSHFGGPAFWKGKNMPESEGEWQK